jgi:Domain of unknown function (DUF4388)
MSFRSDTQPVNPPGVEAADGPEGWDDLRRASLVGEIAAARISVDVAAARHAISASVIQDWLKSYRRSALFAFDESLKQKLVEQGADEQILSSAEITGTLQQISIFDLIQSVEVLGKSALITVTHVGRESRVWCSRGAIVDAESGPLRTEAALYRIASLEHGQVMADLCAKPRERKIFASTPRLLLEAAHRKDETLRLWQRLGDGQQPYRAAQRAMAMSLSPAEQGLLASLSEARSLRGVVDQSELGDLETLTLLIQLRDAQCIQAEPVSEPSGKSPDTGDSIASSRTLTALRPPPRATHVRRLAPIWVGGALGVAALQVAVAWLRWGSAEPPPPIAAVPRLPTPSAAAPAEPPATYTVAPPAEPPSAELRLDGPRLAAPPGAPVRAEDDSSSPATPAQALRRAPRRSARKRPAPRVQVIEDDTPRIKVIE